MTNVLFPEDFHLSADGDDWSPALMRLQQTLALFDTAQVEFGCRRYRCASKVDIIRPNLSFVGIKPGNGIATAIGTSAQIPTLYFPNAGGGIETHYPNSYLGGTYGSLVIGSDATFRGDDFSMSGMAIGGPGTTVGSSSSNGYAGNPTDHGFRPRSACYLSGVAIRGFRGWGIYINASSGSTVGNIGNVNNSYITDVAIYNCGGGAIHVGGGDANQIMVDGPVTIVGCGEDQRTRTASFTRVLAGQHMHEVTITSAVASTLYRLVVSGNNADFTTGLSPTLSGTASGLAAAVNALALANIYAQQIDEDRVLVYSTNSTSFTCTESSANMTLVTTATTATPGAVHCVGGPAQTDIVQGDTAGCWMPSESWQGFLRGDIVDMPSGYGYAEIDLGLEQTGYTGDSISLVSGTTWQLISSTRAWTGPAHTGRTLTIRGSEAPANDGLAFPITAISAGVYGASSVRLRVSYAVANAEYSVMIRGATSGGMTTVSVTASGSPTTSSIRDQLVTAIGAAGITGVTVAATSSADLTITCAGVIVAPGPRMDNVNGTARTVIEYTNSAGVADTAWDGSWTIDNRVAVRGVYAPAGGALIRGRGAQIVDQPLIEGSYRNVLFTGPTDGDGIISKSGRSNFDICYAEGTMPFVTKKRGAVVRLGSMYPSVAAKAELVDATKFSYTPALRASRQDPDVSGSVWGELGSDVYDSVASAFGRNHTTNDEVWRLFYEFTAQGAGNWELALNALSTMVAVRLANLRDTRIGPGHVGIGQPTLYLNWANGALRSPASVIPNGTGGVTITTEGMTGAVGAVTAPVVNGSYNATFTCWRVFPISSVTSATPGSVSIGTHNIPTGMRGRCIIRNVQGTTGANGDREWTRNASSSITLQSAGGTNVTTSGTNVSNTGVCLMGHLTGYGYVTGTSFSPADGTWMVGDRFINLYPNTSGDGVEWVCTVGGVGGASTWVLLYARP